MPDQDGRFTFEPIGVFHGARKHRYETPRQGVLAPDATGVIALLPQRNFEQALRDLEHFERIWVLSVFHLNPHWKPLVSVPRHREDKVGVFATRAPYRPNPIGLSCVRLDGIDGLELRVSEADLLDGSPVLDIKPYLPYADSFPDAHTSWVLDALSDLYTIEEAHSAVAQLDWVRDASDINLRGFIDVQLQHEPASRRRKRIALLSPQSGTSPALYALSYRTWRIVYTIDEDARRVTVHGLASGYTAAELEAGAEDRYGDKDVHRAFLSRFSAASFQQP
ncbi:MAG: tRNA (N6-threonylcarbamoyladenosine(37)-N6)-methyltransferase TrmO [Ignavibacteria bacterium]|nr:tRNA (N6-threonylcarbamoyladenosine(37)-N6)-methyltransferase TrmO [Ignavibacteria bacterium]